MVNTEKIKTRCLGLKAYLWGLIALWTLSIASILAWNLINEKNDALEAARIQARSSLNKDIIYRMWSAMHGGVYVPVTEKNPPNPYLSEVENRDITLPSGKKLTLINPAYMTRQVHELGKELYGARGHITSLKPLRPENGPDPWETETLIAFESGCEEKSAIKSIAGQPHIRLMIPLVTQKGCLKCHGPQGYEEGDIRGGLSVSVPLTSFFVISRAQSVKMVLGYTALWGFGIVLIGLGAGHFKKWLNERERAENNLLQAKEELEDINERLTIATAEANEMAEQVESANVAKSQFLANMSHEIRTPMNAIIGFSDILADENLTDDQAKYVELVRNSGKTLLSLINDILDFSKIEAGQLDTEIIDCSLADLLNSIELLMQPKIKEKGLEFEIVETDGLPAQIRTDPTRLNQCLINLVGNAVKFTEKGHVHVIVSLEQSNSKPFIRFDVEDTGIGIPEEKRGTIFESFTQADGDTTRKYGGTGLGLTITKQLVELLGGELTITSEVGKGSVFSFTIPAGVDVTKQPFLDRHDIASHTDPRQIEAEQHEFSGSILVAEDSPTNQTLIRLLLEKMGLEVTIAEDGNEALQKVLTKEFDLIFMDIMMPNMNGYEATRAIRKEGIIIPIVALTANTMKGDDQKCIEAGCDDYLAKPIDRRKLLKTIAKYLPPKELALIDMVESTRL